MKKGHFGMMYLVSFSLPRFASILHSAMRDYLIKHRLFFVAYRALILGSVSLKAFPVASIFGFSAAFAYAFAGLIMDSFPPSQFAKAIISFLYHR